MHLLLMLCILGGRSVTSDRLTQEGREVGDLRSVIQILGVGAARAGVHGARLVSFTGVHLVRRNVSGALGSHCARRS
jgi:hypothetical protein